MILLSKGPRAVCAVLLFSAIMTRARADVSVVVSPQPISVTRSVGVTMADIWTVRVCNDGDVNVTVPPERIYAAVPNVFFLEPNEAQVVLAQSHLRNRRVKIARCIEAAMLLATVITGAGLVAASPKIVVALGLSAGASQEVADIIQGVAPDVTSISSSLLNAPLTLGPGGCATRLALANIQIGTRPMSVVIK